MKSEQQLPIQREYEMRFADTGEVFHRAFSKNACTFRLQLLAENRICIPGISVPSKTQTRTLHLFVVKTGEKVITEMDAGPVCRLYNVPEAQWFMGVK